MTNIDFSSPLLRADSPLDEASRRLIQDLYYREQVKARGLPTDEPLDPERRRRVELTWQEMWSQPEAVQTTLERERGAIADIASYLGRQTIERIYMVGCGDSLASMVGVRALFEQLLGITCEPMEALDFAYYYNCPVDARTLVLALSSSGLTTRVVEAMLLARALGALTLALSNTADSALMAEADYSLLIHAERKGWPTQSSTAAMATMCQLGIYLARHKGVPAVMLDALESALYATPEQIASALEKHNDTVAAIAEVEAQRYLYLYTGGGPAYACAMFGAAKVKECTPNHAISIPLEEYHHYNSQKAGDPLFLVAPAGSTVQRAVDTAQQGKLWGGQVYGIVTEGDRTLERHVDAFIALPQMPELLVPMVYAVPLQLFAYHVAMAKFRIAEAGAKP